jgi:chromosome segregation ATPase
LEVNSGDLSDYIQLQKEIKRLNEDISHLNEQNRELITKLKANESASNNQRLVDELAEKQHAYDRLQLELKEAHEESKREKLMQLQDRKQMEAESEKLRKENIELKSKLDEKVSEVSALGQQINELNMSINAFRENDASLFAELEKKTEEFVAKLNDLKEENSKLIAEKTSLVERLNSNENADASANSINNSQAEELALLKQQYNQIYSFLEQKNQESLSYYNEIQRLNAVVFELTKELTSAKELNENLKEQCDTLLKEVELQQKMVDELNQQTYELNKTFEQAMHQQQQQDELASYQGNVTTDPEDEEKENLSAK